MRREYALTLETCITVSRRTRRQNTIYISEIDCTLGLAWWLDEDNELDVRVEEITFTTEATYKTAMGESFQYPDKYTISAKSDDEADKALFASLIAEIHYGELIEQVRDQLVSNGEFTPAREVA